MSERIERASEEPVAVERPTEAPAVAAVFEGAALDDTAVRRSSLSVGAVSDPAEREADRVADLVMRR